MKTTTKCGSKPIAPPRAAASFRLAAKIICQ
jgi:hypothetical protein